MKKGLFSSYIAGITDYTHGESYGTIIRYFIPECITAFLLYSVPIWIESGFISQLQSTPTYATLGTTNNLIHFLVKFAEGFSVGTLVLAGQFNGRHNYKEAGRSLRDAFFVTLFIGSIITGMLYFGAYWVYYWFGVPAEIISLGVPFLRTRAIGIFFMFIYFAFVGFLRGIKNTRVPMNIYIAGTFILLVIEYALIFGKFGFPEMGLQGAAIATVIQFAFMATAAIVYVMRNKETAKYGVELFSNLKSTSYIKEIFKLSWPVVLDKTALAAAYIWLLKLVAPMGTSIVATFCVVKDMERFAFAPAVAFASVITFLVSNDYGRKNWDAIKSNLKKTIFLASFFVMCILVLFSAMPEVIIGLFDKKGEFIGLAARAFPIVSMMAFFDLLQIVLCGALRGAANVKTVMMVRILVLSCFFVPASYFISLLPIQDNVTKLLLIYSSFYVGNAIMSFIYINRFRSDEWKKYSV